MITQENIKQLNLDVNLVHLLKRLYNNHCIQETLHIDGKIAGYQIVEARGISFFHVSTCSQGQFLTLLENRLIIKRDAISDDAKNMYAIRYTGAQVLSKLGEIGGDYEIPTELL